MLSLVWSPSAECVHIYCGAIKYAQHDGQVQRRTDSRPITHHLGIMGPTNISARLVLQFAHAREWEGDILPCNINSECVYISANQQMPPTHTIQSNHPQHMKAGKLVGPINTANLYELRYRK